MLTLCSHCAHTVLTLYSHCTHTVLALYSHIDTAVQVRPLEWQSMFVPILPAKLHHFFDAPGQQ